MTQVQILLYLNRMNKRLRHENGPPAKEKASPGGSGGWEYDDVPVVQAECVEDILDVLGPD